MMMVMVVHQCELKHGCLSCYLLNTELSITSAYMLYKLSTLLWPGKRLVKINWNWKRWGIG